jgi:predicted heme/steroid binding protein
MCFWLMSAAQGMAQFGAGTVHFAYTGFDAHIYHVTPNHLWQDLTSMLGAPPVLQTSSGTPTTGFADGVGDHIFYVGASDGHVFQLYYCGRNCVPLNTWILQDITQMAGNAPLPATGSALSSFISSTQEHVLYLGTNLHVYQLVTKSTGGWAYQDLTAAAGGTVAAGGSSLSSFNDSPGQHIFYLGANGHVYQLYYSYSSQTWVDQDLTAQTGGPPAASGSALTSFADSQEHVVYQGNQNIYQLVTHPGGWQYQALPYGSLVPAQGTPLTSTADAHGNEFVFYCGPNGCPAYALIYNGSVWKSYYLAFSASPGIPSKSTWASQVGVLLFVAESEYDLANFSISVGGTATWNNDIGGPPQGILAGASVLTFVDP